MFHTIAAFFQKIGVILCAFFQMLGWWIVPLNHSGDQIRPDYTNPLTVEAIYQDKQAAEAAGGGWYEILIDNFDYQSKAELEQVWDYSLHGNRNQEWWCPQSVSLRGGNVIVGAWLDADPAAGCPGNSAKGNVDGKCAASTTHFHGYGDGEDYEVVTGGINSKLYQAFGYFEVRVQVPRQDGMWSAFWLQSPGQGQIGNGGRDGTEIDVFESVFTNAGLPNQVAHAFLWDGYSTFCRTHGEKIGMGKDMYDGWHTYGLLWTPDCYIFFVDGIATWKTTGGGVSQVPGHLRLTNEVRTTGNNNAAWSTPMKE
ncbi:MAG: glycoside hydrolase family 16 protein, partial [Oscillospiraceae bacterium]|nr:glycoside hydrolase family 16 protein [Oscillospiraceae bacterium]